MVAERTIDEFLETDEFTVLVITGPPASGKSTVVDILEDLGVSCRDTGVLVREEAYRRYDDPDEDDIWATAESIREDRGPAGPTMLATDWLIEQCGSGTDLCCVASCRDQAEVDYLRDIASSVLVIRVDAPLYDRCERYAKMKLDEPDGAVDHDRVVDLHVECNDRESREEPYPDHDVTIENPDTKSMHRLWQQLSNVVCAIGP